MALTIHNPRISFLSISEILYNTLLGVYHVGEVIRFIERGIKERECEKLRPHFVKVFI